MDLPQGGESGNVDKKGRLPIKAGSRSVLGDCGEVVTYRAANGAVRIEPPERWGEFYTKLSRLDNHLPEVNEVQTFYVGGACTAKFEADGRLKIAEHLQDWMGLSHASREVVICPLVGAIELWSRSRYEQQAGEWTKVAGDPALTRIQKLTETVLREASGTVAASDPAPGEA